MSELLRVDVALLGGGISGLSAGFLLADSGRRVVVLEATDRPGGCIRTWRQDGYLFELGPNTVLNNALEIDELFRAAGLLEDRLEAAPSAKRRFVVRRGALVPLPGGPLGFLRTPLFSLAAKLRLLKEPFVGRPPSGKEETIAEFTRRRLGPELLDYAVGPFVSGVYAGDPERLSVRHATAKIHALEERHGSLIRGAIAKRKGPAPAGGIFSFREGLEALPRRLAERLGEGWRPRHRACEVHRQGTGFRVLANAAGGEEIEIEARAVVSALPARSASRVLGPLGGEFPRKIAELPYADVALIALGYRRDRVAHPLDGFGFLAPSVEERHVLGCLFPSSLFEGRAPAGRVALTAFTGGAVHPERVAADDERLLGAVLEDLRPLLGLEGSPELSRVERWQPAIPQYVVGHGALKKAAAELEAKHRGLFISGNLLHGVSVGDCIRNATATAKRVEAHLEGA